MPMPTAAVTSVVMRATPLMLPSESFGTNAIRTAPSSGKNTAAVSAQSSNVSIDLLVADDQHEGPTEDHQRAEEDGGVLLYAPGLDGAEQAAAFFGGEPG